MNIWVEIFKSLAEYGVLGYIAYFFLKNNQKILKEYTNLVHTFQNQHNDLRENLSNGLKYYDATLDQVIKELGNTKSELIAVNTQIMQSIIDDRMLSYSLFFHIAKNVLTISVGKMIIESFEILDINGFTDESQLKLLKENLFRVVESNRSASREEILSLNFDKNLVDIYAKKSEELWLGFSISLKNLISKIDLEDLRNDHNYRKTKLQLKNKLSEYEEDIKVVLKNSLKGENNNNGSQI